MCRKKIGGTRLGLMGSEIICDVGWEVGVRAGKWRGKMEREHGDTGGADRGSSDVWQVVLVYDFTILPSLFWYVKRNFKTSSGRASFGGLKR